MLAFLLDEQISPSVASQLALSRPEIPVASLQQWRDGSLLGASDETVLSAAAEESRALVTYDLKTIPPLLVEWASQGRSHAGVIFVDNRTIPSSDIGGLIRAIAQLWALQGAEEWTDRLEYLRRSPT